MIQNLIGAGVLVVAGGLLTFNRGEPTQVVIPKPGAAIPKDNVDPRMPAFLICAKACDDCARICDTCTAHCARLTAEGKKEHLTTLRLCQDCAAVCQAAARVVGKDGPLSDLMMAACAEACKRCGDACAKLASDPMMKQCADECRRCEKACRDMTKPTGKE